ncbi:MAG: NlpC/P60 family protein [Carbonactinosporaceae bacterium]
MRGTRRTRAGLCGAITIALLLPVTGSAAADTVEGQGSGQSVQAMADQVGRLEARLAGAESRLEQLRVAAAAAVEAYNGALIRLEAAKEDLRDARARTAASQRHLTAARDRLGEVAAATYRSGGSLTEVAAFVGADGPQALMDRVSLLRYVHRHRNAVYSDFQAASLVAEILQRQADRALTRQHKATDRVRAAKRRAQASVEGQQRRLAGIAATRDRLQTRLVAARQADAGLGGGASAGASAGTGGTGASAVSGTPQGSSSGTSSGAQAAIDYARAQLGKPYEWAADGPDSFDCSGLTMMAWQQGGVSLPHWSVGQYEQSEKVSLGEMRPGDLVFYANDPDDYGSIHHVGLYIGDGQMIEAPYTGANVRIASIHVWSDLFGAARP